MSKTQDAPERIWAFDYDLQDDDGAWRNWQCWSDSDPKPLNATEYIRADLVQAKDAEIARLRAELEWYGDPVNYETQYESLPCGCCTDIFEPINDDKGERAAPP